jgi:hypothetical protein
MPSDVEVCSQSLQRLGADPITSFTEGNNGPLCANLYPQIKLNVETSAPWRFNTIKSQLLNRTLITPPTQYKYAYQLPAKMLNKLIRTAWNSPFNQGRSNPFTNFDIFEDKLLTSAEQILIDYQIEKVTDEFPTHIIELTISAFLAAWGRPDEMGRGGYSRVARRIDSQGHPSQAIKNYPLTAVRHGGL